MYDDHCHRVATLDFHPVTCRTDMVSHSLVHVWMTSMLCRQYNRQRYNHSITTVPRQDNWPPYWQYTLVFAETRHGTTRSNNIAYDPLYMCIIHRERERMNVRRVLYFLLEGRVTFDVPQHVDGVIPEHHT